MIIIIQHTNKYRAKLINTNVWVYGQYIVKNNINYIYTENDDEYHEVIESTVSAFKGTHQGVEFYVGDIIRNSEGYYSIIENHSVVTEDLSPNIVYSGHGEYHNTNAPYILIDNIWDNVAAIENLCYQTRCKDTILRNIGIYTSDDFYNTINRIKYRPKMLCEEVEYNTKEHYNIIRFRYIHYKIAGVRAQITFTDMCKIYSGTKINNNFVDYSDKILHIINEIKDIRFKGVLECIICSDIFDSIGENKMYVDKVLSSENPIEIQKEHGFLKCVLIDIPSDTLQYIDRYNELQKIFETLSCKYITISKKICTNITNGWKEWINSITIPYCDGLVYYDKSAYYADVNARIYVNPRSDNYAT